MAIFNRTRKILWARSGNRCALCRCELVLASEAAGDLDAVVGDECHIVARAPGFARHRNNEEHDSDGYDNLILLCKTHHKQIDDQPDRFTEDYLLGLKTKHETWVRSTLEGSKNGQDAAPVTDGITLLPRIASGKQLITMIQGSEMYKFDHESLDSSDEVDLIASFLQNCQDYGDILDDYDAGEVVRAGFTMQQQLDELKECGFLVFGEIRPQVLEFDVLKETCELQSLTLVILRESNPAIIRRNYGNEYEGGSVGNWSEEDAD